MRLILWMIGFLIAVDLAAFAVFNRQIVPVYWSPVHPALDLPLYAVGLLFVAYGFIIGAACVWLNNAPLRKTRRLQRRQIKNLEKELADISESGVKQAPPADFFPALTKK